MSDKYPIEVLLRPPVELFAGFVTLICTLCMLLAPEALYMPQTVAIGAASVLIPVSLIDFWSGYKIVRYRRGMSRSSVLSLKTSDIPVLDDQLYLGEGFEWKQRHTQRYHDTQATRYEDYLHLGEHDKVRDLEKRIEHIPVVNLLTRFTKSHRLLNPWPPKSPLDGSSALHGVEVHKRPVYLKTKNRRMHTYVSGASGAGKTEAMELYVAQDIRRASRDVVIVMDPKGSHSLLGTCYTECKAAGREDDLIVFHIGFPEISAMYNIAGNYSRMTEVAGRLTSHVSGDGQSAVFKSFGWRYLALITRACEALNRPINIMEIRKYIGDFSMLYVEYAEKLLNDHCGDEWKEDHALSTRTLQKLMDRKGGRLPYGQQPVSEQALFQMLENDYPEIVEGDLLYADLVEVWKMSRDYYSRITASIRPVIDKLSAGQLAQILSPSKEALRDGKKKILDWEMAIRRRSVLYIALDAMADAEIASVVGAGFVADFVSTCSRIYKDGILSDTPGGRENEQFNIWGHWDEMDVMLGDEFIPTINKIRGASVGLTVYSQVQEDFEIGLGSTGKARQAMGSINNYILFRCGSTETAALITQRTDDVNVLNMVNITSASDSDDMLDGSVFTSRNEDRAQTEKVPLLTESMFMKLPIGEAFVSLDGGQIMKMKVPLRVRSKQEEALPKSLSGMCEYMQKHYRPGSGWEI